VGPRECCGLIFSLEFDSIDNHLLGPIGRLNGPVTVGLDHAGWGGAWNICGMAVVGSDDPKLARLRANPQVCFVEGPVDFSGPFAPVASTVDCMEDDLRSFLGQLLAEMRIGHRGTSRVGPHVVADQGTNGNPLELERSQRACCVVIDFTLGRFGHCATTKGLGVKSEELPIGVIESNLVVASSVVRLDEAGS